MSLGTRAVLRLVEPGEQTPCACGCERRITWAARQRRRQVICNVYDGDRWSHVSHWFPEHYEAAGEPHGKPHG